MFAPFPLKVAWSGISLIPLLSFQVSQITEEKSHATSKLNVLTRTVQEKDQRMRVAKKELEEMKSKYKGLEEEKPRQVSEKRDETHIIMVHKTNSASII